MSAYALLLIQGASEVREYKNSPNSKLFGDIWLDRLVEDMERASALSDQLSIAHAIEDIAHRLIDSGPLDAFPSFNKALDALQRSRKRKHG